jgi:hypothetical protein
LPSTANIRKYQNLRAVSLHLVEINKQHQALAKTIDKIVKANDKVITVGPSARQKITVKQALPQPIVDKIANNSKVIDKLSQQYAALSNMILNLNTQFKTSNVDPKLVDLLTSKIAELQNQIRSQRDIANKAATHYGQSYASNVGISYAKKIMNFLNKKFSTKGTMITTSGMIDGQPCITHFVKYENIKNDKDEIEPMVTVAISEYQGHHWINPNSVQPRSVGKFRLGFQLDDDEKKALIQIQRYVQEQMAADSLSSTHSLKLIPITKKQAGLQKYNNAVFTDKSIVVTFPKKEIKTEAQAKERAEAIYRNIHHAYVASHPGKRSFDRIVYPIKQVGDNWVVTYMFVTGDKFTGRTMTNDEHQKLNNIFDPHEVAVLKKALNSMFD